MIWMKYKNMIYMKYEQWVHKHNRVSIIHNPKTARASAPVLTGHTRARGRR